jgi:hypothetical protein
MPKQTQSKTKNPKSPLKRLLATLGCTIAIILLASIAAELSHQQHLNALTSEVKKIEDDNIKPLGGVEYASNIRGDHFFNTYCLGNGPCPMVTHLSYIPMEASQDARIKLVEGILKKEGYTFDSRTDDLLNQTHGYGSKGKLVLDIAITGIGSHKPPYAAPAGKEWRVISVSAYDSANPR